MRIAEGDFLLPVDKPAGPTSHGVVSKARRALGTRRIGHTGTLDPFASGLLVLCAGQATRLAEYITGMDKGYQAVACLGLETDTLDLSGKVTSMDDRWRHLDPSSIEEVVLSQIGLIEQEPPQFVAVVHDLGLRAMLAALVASMGPRMTTPQQRALSPFGWRFFS